MLVYWIVAYCCIAGLIVSLFGGRFNLFSVINLLPIPIISFCIHLALIQNNSGVEFAKKFFAATLFLGVIISLGMTALYSNGGDFVGDFLNLFRLIGMYILFNVIIINLIAMLINNRVIHKSQT